MNKNAVIASIHFSSRLSVGPLTSIFFMMLIDTIIKLLQLRVYLHLSPYSVWRVCETQRPYAVILRKEI